MNFKSFLIENPDTVSPTLKRKLSSSPKSWREGQTFTLFDDYYLYSLEDKAVIHEIIARRIVECRLAVEAAVRNEISVEELNECIISPDPRTGEQFLASEGTINKKVLQQLLKTIDLMEVKRDTESDKLKPKFIAYRTLSIQKTPDVILGRIWKDYNIISFWGSSSSIFDETKNIIGFVGLFGDPTKYTYEIEEVPLDYGDFLKRNINVDSKPKFDQSIIHAMPPGEVKQQFQRMMGMKKTFSPVDLATRQKALTSEMASFSLPHLIQIKGEDYSAIDMQFELEPKTLDKDGHVMNQGSKFIAKMPDSHEYIAYDGKGYARFVNPAEVVHLLDKDYETIPDNWYLKANFI